MTSDWTKPGQNINFELTDAERAQIAAYTDLYRSPDGGAAIEQARNDGTPRIYVIVDIYGGRASVYWASPPETKMSALMYQAKSRQSGYECEIRLMFADIKQARTAARRKTHADPNFSMYYFLDDVDTSGALSFTLSSDEQELLHKYESTWETARNLQFYTQAANDGTPRDYVLVECMVRERDMTTMVRTIDASKEPRTRMAAVLHAAKASMHRGPVYIFTVDQIREHYERARAYCETYLETTGVSD